MAMEEDLSSRKSSRVVSNSNTQLRRGTMNSNPDWTPQLIEKLFNEPNSDAGNSSPQLGLPTPDTIDSHDEIIESDIDMLKDTLVETSFPVTKAANGRGKRKIVSDQTTNDADPIKIKKPKKEPKKEKKIAYKKVGKANKKLGNAAIYAAKKALSSPPLDSLIDINSYSDADRDTVQQEPIPDDPEIYGYPPAVPCRPTPVNPKGTLNSMIKRTLNIQECLVKIDAECDVPKSDDMELCDYELAYDVIQKRLHERINQFLEEYEAKS